MKVLQINSVCGIKSTGRICTDLADVLTDNGHECKIAYGREIVPEKYREYAVKIGSDFDVNMHVLNSRLFDSSGWGSKHVTKKFIKWVMEYNPDIIHLHNIHGYYINIEILFNYLAEIEKPVIWTLHDCWSLTGHCVYFTAHGCDKWKGGCYKCDQMKTYPKSYIGDNSKKNWNIKKNLFTDIKNMTLITPSTWLANVVKESYLNKYPIEVIPNGIDINTFKLTPSDFRRKYNLENKIIILGVASIWDERKGLYDFIELSKKITEEYIIVLIGLSKNQLKALPVNIIGITKTNNITELAEIYTTADVFINFSKEETMGLVTVESLACGTPVIVLNKTAIPEVVDESCGIIIEDNNIEIVIQSLEHALLLKRDNCIKRAQLYEKQQQYLKYINIYQSMYNSINGE